jgi:hypothetical protein
MGWLVVSAFIPLCPELGGVLISRSGFTWVSSRFWNQVLRFQPSPPGPVASIGD